MGKHVRPRLERTSASTGGRRGLLELWGGRCRNSDRHASANADQAKRRFNFDTHQKLNGILAALRNVQCQPAQSEGK